MDATTSFGVTLTEREIARYVSPLGGDHRFHIRVRAVGGQVMMLHAGAPGSPVTIDPGERNYPEDAV